MTFLNPLVLFGLTAAAIPIIIHLLNLRKLRTIEFSSLQFLKELQRTRMRRLKIRQILLLILRTLLVIAIVLAFSRPALQGSMAGLIGTHAKTTMLILLDDSPSMGVRNDGGQLFTQAKGTAARIGTMLNEGDEVFLLRLSESRQNKEPVPLRTQQELTAALDQTDISQRTVHFRDALGRAAKIIGESKNFNKELYLLTDAQGSQFIHEAGDTSVLLDERGKIFLADAEIPRVQNLGINSVHVKSQIIAQNRPVAMEAIVRNHGDRRAQNTMLSVYLDGSRVVQQSLDIEGGRSSAVRLTLLPKRRGILPGYLQLEDDGFEPDNRHYFVLDVPQNVGVLCVGGTQEELRYPTLALTAGADTAASRLLNVQRVLRNQFSSTDIRTFDVILLAGVKDFSQTDAERIGQFVRAGGGLIVFPGNETDIANYNATLLRQLGIPPLGSITETRSSANDPATGFLTFDKIDFAHALFAGLFEEQPQIKKPNYSIESPRIYKTITPTPGRRGQSIITLTNGTSFLTEYPADAGRVLVYSVGTGAAWSDFSLKGIFAPLLHRSVMYMAAGQSVSSDIKVGDEIKITLRLKTRGDQQSYVLTSPGGTEERIVPRFLGNSGFAAFESENSREAGIYVLRAAPSAAAAESSILQAIAVNVDPRESQLTKATNEELARFWTSIGVNPDRVQHVPNLQKLDTAVMESRFGVELWKYLIGLGVLLALSEMAIGRVPKSDMHTAA
jgi:hypothetical protein